VYDSKVGNTADEAIVRRLLDEDFILNIEKILSDDQYGIGPVKVYIKYIKWKNDSDNSMALEIMHDVGSKTIELIFDDLEDLGTDTLIDPSNGDTYHLSIKSTRVK
tara:strand:+ start:610 stop:927 length:318 start_codon:yes stop_codon:yes gene_type:complete